MKWWGESRSGLGMDSFPHPVHGPSVIDRDSMLDAAGDYVFPGSRVTADQWFEVY